MDEQRPHASIGRVCDRESYDLALDFNHPAPTKLFKMLTLIAFGDDREDEPILVDRKAHAMHRGYVTDGSLTKHCRSHDASSMIGTSGATGEVTGALAVTCGAHIEHRQQDQLRDNV